jgi:hypothetical protein
MMTHHKQRADAIVIGRDHLRREFVPTIWGEKEGNTKFVSTLKEFRAAGGGMHFNEDQTEIVLTLPEGWKFSIKFPDRP